MASQILLVICAKLWMTFPGLTASQQPWRTLLCQIQFQIMIVQERRTVIMSPRKLIAFSQTDP